MKERKMSLTIKRFLNFLIVAALCTGFYFGGFFVGSGKIYRDASGKIEVSPVAVGSKADMNLYNQVWQIINEKYVGNVSDQDKIYGSISGLVASLNDPYSMFLKPSDNTQFQQDLNGSFEGIGAEIATQNNKLVIVSPIDGSPAQKAGLKAQDVIVAIDKKATDQMDVTAAVDLIRGAAGTKVTLSILRTGWSAPKDFVITRDKITVASVTWSMKPNNIGYIKISLFGDDTTTLLKKAINEINQKNPKGIIIDVRNDPGGLLDQAISVTSEFIQPGVVVQRKYKDGHIETDKTTGSPEMAKPKMVVLVDEGSASASEIFAGAIQDDGRGVLIGEKTFGKGSVQDMISLPGGAAVKVTSAKWLTPKGRTIDGKGLTPDITVAAAPEGQSGDPQLDRALLEVQK